MAQFRKDLNDFVGSNKTIYEVMMLADGSGNIISPSSGGSLVSEDNSTTTPLNDSQTFTGEWEDVSSYESVIVAVKTDQNGYFTIQFSPDGTNVDSTLTRYYRTDVIEAPHRFTVTRRFCRITFTNDSGSNQTELRLQTTFGSKPDLNIPIDSVMSPDFDAIAVRPTEFKYEAALGLRQGVVVYHKWGYNLDVDSGGVETIWAPGGQVNAMSVANTITISSTSNNDIAVTGTGARTLYVDGIDENRDRQEEYFDLDGSNDVISETLWLGINRSRVESAGDTMSNEGDIDISATDAGNRMAFIPTGEGVTQQLIFYTYRNHKALLEWLKVNCNKLSGGGTPRATITGWVTDFTKNVRYEIFRTVIDTSVENNIEPKPPVPIQIPSSAMFELECGTTVDNTVVNARLQTILFKNVDA